MWNVLSYSKWSATTWNYLYIAWLGKQKTLETTIAPSCPSMDGQTYCLLSCQPFQPWPSRIHLQELCTAFARLFNDCKVRAALNGSGIYVSSVRQQSALPHAWLDFILHRKSHYTAWTLRRRLPSCNRRPRKVLGITLLVVYPVYNQPMTYRRVRQVADSMTNGFAMTSN